MLGVGSGSFGSVRVGVGSGSFGTVTVGSGTGNRGCVLVGAGAGCGAPTPPEPAGRLLLTGAGAAAEDDPWRAGGPELCPVAGRGRLDE